MVIKLYIEHIDDDLKQLEIWSQNEEYFCYEYNIIGS